MPMRSPLQKGNTYFSKNAQFDKPADDKNYLFQLSRLEHTIRFGNEVMDATTMTPLLKTVRTTVTDFWNDSNAADELQYAIDNGAVGATTNPSIVLAVLKKELTQWKAPLQKLINDNPTDGEDDIAWKLIEEMGLRGAKMLEPIFKREGGQKGRLSMQTNPIYYNNAAKLIEQSVHFDGLAENIQVKIPATKAGIEAIEEVTRQGVVINATVSFTLSQAIAVAEAVERGLASRQAEGNDISNIHPACTIMIGRTDDWIKATAARDGIITTPSNMDWAGIAVMKKAYAIFKERGYRTRLLAAAYRHHLHWSELIGGDLILTIPHNWQLQFNNSDIEVRERMDDPVDPTIVAELAKKFPEFVRAYSEGGLSLEEFDSYGATTVTLRSFIEAYRELTSIVRDQMLIRI